MIFKCRYARACFTYSPDYSYSSNFSAGMLVANGVDGMNKLRILVGDDHALMLAGIQELLKSKYDVVACAADGKQAVHQALRLCPDVVVLDISMPELNGLEAGREILNSLPSTKLVILSMHTNPLYLRKALQIGARAYVLKTGLLEELLEAIQEVADGKLYVSPGFGRDVLNELDATADGASNQRDGLTDRQLEILQLIAEGRLSKEIAHIAGISIKTVDFHRARIMSKLGVKSVAQLVRMAVEQGLIASGVSKVN